ncbi:uncharacterized protein CBL_13410 [Carabus blaptoides fortunei]
MMKKLSLSLIQLKVGASKTANINRAFDKISVAATTKDLRLVALPECFNSPYGIQYFRENAEQIPDGPTCSMLSKAAKQNSLFVVGGTIPEIDGDEIFNTCTVWNPNGELIAKYRKMHLFDIDIPGKITFKESEILKSGNELATFNIESMKIGLGICYDLRFEELAKLYRKQGCDMIIYPGAFNMTTGPIHWELLQRARAVDNQLYVCGISPARGTKGYIAYGYTQITDPWGCVESVKDEEALLYSTVELSKITSARTSIPIFDQRRLDIYDTIMK